MRPTGILQLVIPQLGVLPAKIVGLIPGSPLCGSKKGSRPSLLGTLDLAFVFPTPTEPPAMAEVFGVVTGALSVAALFQNCVECFEYIHLGRSFGRDFERCQLRLDVARNRLWQWGDAIQIKNDARFQSTSPTESPVRLAQSILDEISRLFGATSKISKRYEMRADAKDLVLFNEGDMKPAGRGLHNHMKSLAKQRQDHTNLAKKATWALYDGKHFDNFVNQIATSLDELETVFPINAARKKSVKIEIEELEDEPRLKMLKEAAHDIDELLEEEIEHKINVVEGRNWAGDMKTEGEARVQLGNMHSEGALHGGIAIHDNTINSVDSLTSKGGSGVHIGNTYGGRGIWG